MIAVRALAVSITTRLAVGANTGSEATEIQQVLDTSWRIHLEHQMHPDTQPTPQDRTWYAHELIEAEATNEQALNVLIRAYQRDEEIIMAGAVANHAADLGITNRFIKPAAYRTLVTPYFVNSDTESNEPGTLDVINEAIRTPDGFESLKRIHAVEGNLRNMLRKKSDTEKALTLLAKAYQTQHRYVHSYLLTNLLLYHNPTNTPVVRMQIKNLDHIKHFHLDALMVTRYANLKKELSKQYLPDLVGKALATQKPDWATLFAQLWTKKEPKNGHAWQILGEILFRSGKQEQALDAMTRAAEQPGHTPDLYVLLARLSASNDDDLAIRTWLKRYRTSTNDEAFLNVLRLPEFKNQSDLLSNLK